MKRIHAKLTQAPFRGLLEDRQALEIIGEPGLGRTIDTLIKRRSRSLNHSNINKLSGRPLHRLLNNSGRNGADPRKSHASRRCTTYFCGSRQSSSLRSADGYVEPAWRRRRARQPPPAEPVAILAATLQFPSCIHGLVHGKTTLGRQGPRRLRLRH